MTKMVEHNWPRGWKPYTSLFGCFLLMFNSWGLVNAYGTFQSYYTQQVLANEDQLLLNLIGATQSFIVLFFSFIVGRILDAGYSRVLIGLGAGLTTGGMLLLSIVDTGSESDGSRYGFIWLTQGFVVGCGMACYFVSSSQVAATWFPKRKAVAIGIVACGASIAGLLYPLAIRYLITDVEFSNAVRYVAIIVGVTSIAAFCLATPNPEFTFYKPPNWWRARIWIDSNAFRCPAWCWFTAGICFMFFGFYAVFFNLEDWAAYNGIAVKEAAAKHGSDMNDTKNTDTSKSLATYWLLSLMNASSTFGRILSACCSQGFGTINIHTIVTFTGSLLLLGLWTQVFSLGATIPFVILYGMISGAIIGLPPASIAELLSREDESMQSRLGHWVGMMYTISSVFALVGPLISGHLVSKYGNGSGASYLSIQLWSGACLFLAATCMMVARWCMREVPSEANVQSGREEKTEHV